MASVDELSKTWRFYGREFLLLSRWDCARGMMFVSDSSGDAESAVSDVAEIVAPDSTITFDCATVTDADFERQIDFLTPKEHQESLLEPRPKRPCIILWTTSISR